jgi:branched-chain amino acid aminotransferase
MIMDKSSIWVSLNGEILEGKKAKISIFDRGFLFGDSVYEVTRSYQGVFYLFDEHLDRLENSAHMIAMSLDWSRERFKEEIIKLVDTVKDKFPESTDFYIRIIVTRGEGEIHLDPAMSEGNQVVMILKPFGGNPAEWWAKGVSLKISSVLRNHPKALHPNAKSGNYLNNILALREAKKEDFFDAVLLDSMGRVTESTTSNIWIVKDGILKTPPLDVGILRGITREKVIEYASRLGVPCEETHLFKEDLLSAEECFLTSSTKEILPVAYVDNHDMSSSCPGVVASSLQKAYSEGVQEFCAKKKQEGQII